MPVVNGVTVIGNFNIGAGSAVVDNTFIPESCIGAAYRYTAVAGDLAVAVAVYSEGAVGSPQCDVGVYTFNGTNPVTMAGFGRITTGPSPGWYYQAVNIPLIGGQTYVPACDFWINAAYTIHFDSPGGTISAGNTGASLPPTWTTNGGTWGDAGSYFVVVAGAGPAQQPRRPRNLGRR